MKREKQLEILKELLRQVDTGKNIDCGAQVRMSTQHYTDPEIASREWHSFFKNHTQLIGLSGDLPKPGTYFTTSDFGVPVLAVRGQDGEFRAFLNACRHRGVRVAEEGRGQANKFTCPFHAWTYSNKGDLVAIPQQEQWGELDKSCHGLKQLPALERDGLLWVHPQPDGKIDLDEQLGPLVEEIAGFNFGDLVYMGESVLEMGLNWKLANDTFGETYHFQKLHKDTLGQLFYGDNLSYETFGKNHRFVFANRSIDELHNLPESEWVFQAYTNLLWFLFPNIQFNVGGGSVSLIKIYPDPEKPGRSLTRVGHYFSREAVEMQEMAKQDPNIIVSGADEAYLFEDGKQRVLSLEAVAEVFVSTIEQEDYLMGESTQRAVDSGLMDEVIFGRNEPALHHYHRTFAEALQIPGPQPL
ncbi:MAG: aromatic ring-hydroxylating dioxygenase subunit alpha [Pseudomonadota bacterium]